MPDFDYIKKSKPVILGCSGLSLTEEEKSFFSDIKPLGFILFKRNIKSREQLKSLVNELHDNISEECLIMIDQEGGRVQRLDSTNGFADYPDMLSYTIMSKEKGLDIAKQELFENITAMCQPLKELNIRVNCAPVLDVLSENTSIIIGNRSFGYDPELVSVLGDVVRKAIQDLSLIPVMKHIPGHGRAQVDSHKALPVVNTSIEEMRKTDFIPFQKLSGDIGAAMLAHIRYMSVDSENISTFSKKVINLIREEINFQGVIFSDDICMKALADFSNKEKAEKFLSAGGDIVLHCNGDMSEMKPWLNDFKEVIKEETLVRLKRIL